MRQLSSLGLPGSSGGEVAAIDDPERRRPSPGLVVGEVPARLVRRPISVQEEARRRPAQLRFARYGPLRAGYTGLLRLPRCTSAVGARCVTPVGVFYSES